jgi:hypothetical protein
MIGKLTSAEEAALREVVKQYGLSCCTRADAALVHVHLATRERAAQIVESLCFVGRTPETQRIVDKFKSDVLKALREADYTEALRKAGCRSRKASDRCERL